MKEEEMQVCQGEVPCTVSAKRMWRSSCEDIHICLPKALPSVIKRIDYEGDPFQPGSFRIVHYHESYTKLISKENRINFSVECTKEKILEIDDDALKVKLEVVEGGYLGIMVTYYNYTMYFVEGSLPDTCVAHWSFQYKPISPKHNAMMRARLMEVLPLSFKGLEAYLLASDDYQD